MNEDTFKAKRVRERLEFLNVRSEFIELENLEIYQKKKDSSYFRSTFGRQNSDNNRQHFSRSRRLSSKSFGVISLFNPICIKMVEDKTMGT